ncbi:hypothetical protein HD553DRAFT_326313 [Filobasidium floriforme]|uniref:uncharacterized protein n=1 Tax=Filobasidium floriforme TaxID=5210 RepID=UPI001E8E4658|nr:uncharacterized protein HD553DRAFT_326313 [Filobasidium floriforme]KAH8080002.1 hypothetical protein HD553DRAFT_326313 [Filobasidium floriforme]
MDRTTIVEFGQLTSKERRRLERDVYVAKEKHIAKYCDKMKATRFEESWLSFMEDQQRVRAMILRVCGPGGVVVDYVPVERWMDRLSIVLSCEELAEVEYLASQPSATRSLLDQDRFQRLCALKNAEEERRGNTWLHRLRNMLRELVVPPENREDPFCKSSDRQDLDEPFYGLVGPPSRVPSPSEVASFAELYDRPNTPDPSARRRMSHTSAKPYTDRTYPPEQTMYPRPAPLQQADGRIEYPEGSSMYAISPPASYEASRRPPPLSYNHPPYAGYHLSGGQPYPQPGAPLLPQPPVRHTRSSVPDPRLSRYNDHPGAQQPSTRRPSISSTRVPSYSTRPSTSSLATAAVPNPPSVQGLPANLIPTIPGTHIARAGRVLMTYEQLRGASYERSISAELGPWPIGCPTHCLMSWLSSHHAIVL